MLDLKYQEYCSAQGAQPIHAGNHKLPGMVSPSHHPIPTVLNDVKPGLGDPKLAWQLLERWWLEGECRSKGNTGRHRQERHRWLLANKSTWEVPVFFRFMKAPDRGKFPLLCRHGSLRADWSQIGTPERHDMRFCTTYCNSYRGYSIIELICVMVLITSSTYIILYSIAAWRAWYGNTIGKLRVVQGSVWRERNGRDPVSATCSI